MVDQVRLAMLTEPDEFTLTVKIGGPGSGSVSISPEKPTYQFGEVVTLTANPDPGSTFAGWSGNLQGNPVEITITADITVTATFEPLTACVVLSGVDFTWSTLVMGEPVQFTAVVEASTQSYTYTWDFGDDDPISGADPSYTFPVSDTAVTYTVTLAVSNACSQKIQEHFLTFEPPTTEGHHLFLPLVGR